MRSTGHRRGISTNPFCPTGLRTISSVVVGCGPEMLTATSLALALLVGGRVYAAMKRSLHTGEWLRRGLGAAVIGGAVAIGFGLDTGILARLSLPGTTAFEQAAIDAFGLNAFPDESSGTNWQAICVIDQTDYEQLLEQNRPMGSAGAPATEPTSTPLTPHAKLAKRPWWKLW